MLRHSPHHTHARCGETSNFSTSVMWRNLKLLNMGRNFRFLHICHAYKFEISPHDKFFSTYLTCDICDKYRVCSQLAFTFVGFSHISQFFSKSFCDLFLKMLLSPQLTWMTSNMEEQTSVHTE